MLHHIGADAEKFPVRQFFAPGTFFGHSGLGLGPADAVASDSVSVLLHSARASDPPTNGSASTAKRNGVKGTSQQ